MKICHLTSAHPYKDTRIFLKECRSLSKSGYAVHLIAPSAPNEKINGIDVHGVEKEAGGRFKRMTKTVNDVYKKAVDINAEIYHFHDPELIPVGLKLKRAGKKVIYDVHEDVPRQILSKHWIRKGIRRSISWSFEQYENHAAKKFDGVVTATPFINERFSKLGCHAVNVNNYPLIDELQLKVKSWEKKQHAVCYVGGIGKIRGIHEMVEAIKKVDGKLLLAGAFANKEDEHKAIRKEGWEKVDFLGYLDREGIREVFQQSVAGLVVLHPTANYIDALPVKMFEYMAAGIPVIASNFPLWNEIIEENQCGICVDPLEPKKIANAIQFFIKNPVEAKRMGQNGRLAIKEKYNWETENMKLLQLYNQIESTNDGSRER
ncbi:glycosyltransferase family 4 protein [Halalkalibacterium ligniniphilum]|uniref:glycosyltransferase family 4 protein n=1 Tax=Halalkalibacterium ligniniphilum TaxID=1134413 RepID=UPI00034CDB32|nr:glycosyltransferase family 4 protein [Halalkalibacterium ligniniphilum]